MPAGPFTIHARGSAIGPTDFWLDTPIRPLLGFTFPSIGGKEHPNESMTLLPGILRVPRENGMKTATTRSETCRWFLTSLWFLFCGRNGRMKKADHQEYQSKGLVWSKFRGASYVSLFCSLETRQSNVYSPVKRVLQLLGLSSPDVNIYLLLSYPSYVICGRLRGDATRTFSMVLWGTCPSL